MCRCVCGGGGGECVCVCVCVCGCGCVGGSMLTWLLQRSSGHWRALWLQQEALYAIHGHPSLDEVVNDVREHVQGEPEGVRG